MIQPAVGTLREANYYEVRTIAFFGLERYEDVARNFHDIAPPQHFDYCYLAAALAHLGRVTEADAAKRNVLHMVPGYSISVFAALDHYKNREDQQRVIIGLRRAGFPE